MKPAARHAVFAFGGLLCLLAVLWMADTAFAQANPFGPRAPNSGPMETGLVAWLLTKQAEFYRSMSAAIRAAKADGSALFVLLGISFAYGIFHAAGPGHGKAVISSYVVANKETWRRGVALSFASAFIQSLVAVLLVAVAVLLFNATRQTMDTATRAIEIVSYALIAALGLRLLWIKGRAFIAEWQAQTRPKVLSAAVAHAHDHHAHDHHDHAHGHDHHEGHAHHDHDHHDHNHDHHHHEYDAHCGHSHGPDPSELAGPGGWKRGLSAIFAVGLRPCSGAILVLVFAAAQGALWAGIAATFVMGLGTAITVAAIATLAVSARALAAKFAEARAGRGLLFLRGVETAAAALVLVFGLALLTGYMVSERILT